MVTTVQCILDKTPKYENLLFHKPSAVDSQGETKPSGRKKPVKKPPTQEKNAKPPNTEGMRRRRSTVAP
jgi:hypothetical protein